MQRIDQIKLLEIQDAIFQGIEKLLSEQGLSHLKASGLEIEIGEPTNETDDPVMNLEPLGDALFSLDQIDCGKGFKRVVKINPITKKQKVVCVPIDE